jgi:hypothetical protein
VYDYRPINNITKDEEFDMPNTKDIRTKAAGHRMYGSLDLDMAFNTLRCADKETEELTAISAPHERSCSKSCRLESSVDRRISRGTFSRFWET